MFSVSNSRGGGFAASLYPLQHEDADDQCQAIGAATEHTRSIGVVSGDDTTEPGNGPRSTGDATEHTEDNNGDDDQAHDQSRAMSAATDHDRKKKEAIETAR